MSTEPVTLSREELDDQVWPAPMRTLAQRFGISECGAGEDPQAAEGACPGSWLLGEESGQDTSQETAAAPAASQC